MIDASLQEWYNYRISVADAGWCTVSFTFRQQITCLNFHPLRGRQSAMPPHRLIPSPCGLKIHSPLFN